MMKTGAFLRGLTDILFPRICHVCGSSLVRGENVLCLDCFSSLPRTEISLLPFSEIHKRLASPGVPIEKAGSWFYYYRDSRYASLIRDAKYNNLPSLAEWMGRQCASELQPRGFFNGIDLLLPVPMHPLKKLIRGYNQSEVIAGAISDVTSVPVGNHLYVKRYHPTQTLKSAEARVMNAEGAYGARDNCKGLSLTGKHVMIIDDVITTGATMLANCRAILDAAPTVRISVLSIAVAHLR